MDATRPLVSNGALDDVVLITGHRVDWLMSIFMVSWVAMMKQMNLHLYLMIFVNLNLPVMFMAYIECS